DSGFVFFYFSSRRRHTRFSRDWSSDVCSSDLLQTQLENVIYRATFEADEPTRLIVQTAPYDDATAAIGARADAGNAAGGIVSLQIGRASCGRGGRPRGRAAHGRVGDVV